MLLIFDASSILRAWDDYPIEQFPGFWRWIAAQVKAQKWSMCRLNLDEVKHKSPECEAWLKSHSVRVLPVTQPIATEALAIRTALGIEADGYHKDGVDEADVILIATCKMLNAVCVSDEAIQPNQPPSRRRFKVPAVCGMQSVAVPWRNLMKVVREAGVVFDSFS